MDISSENGYLLILGDFRVHWDSHEDTDTKCLSEILRSANLTQHAQKGTHRQSHIVDFITGEGDHLVRLCLYISCCLITFFSTVKFFF